MAKREKVPPDVQSLRKAVARFTKQLDRGTALVAAAWLDDTLETCIRAAFRPDKDTADELLRPDGPIGSFSARIKLAYLLDLIEPTARKDLDRIRRIRNDFAHGRGDLRFTTPSVRDRCGQLHGAEACRVGGWPLRSPKQRFVVTAYFLAEYLMFLTKPRKRNPLLDQADSYGSWIRRTLKSSTLALLMEELKKVDAEATPKKADLAAEAGASDEASPLIRADAPPRAAVAPRRRPVSPNLHQPVLIAA